MGNKLIVTAPAGSNTVSAREWVEQDGSGAVKVFDDTGTPLGVALTDKDSENNVGVVRRGLHLCEVSALADYNFGDKLKATSSGVAAYDSGTVVGFAAETKSDLATSELLLVDINIEG